MNEGTGKSERKDAIIELEPPPDAKMQFRPIGMITEKNFNEWKKKSLVLAIAFALVSNVACGLMGEYLPSPLGLVLGIVVGMVLFVPGFYLGMQAVTKRTITVVEL